MPYQLGEIQPGAQGGREVLAEQLGVSELPKAEEGAVGEEQVQQRQEE